MFGAVPNIFGRNRKSRVTEAAGRRNYPEAVPKRRGQKKESDVSGQILMIRKGEGRTPICAV